MSSLLQRCGGCIRFGGQAHIRTLLALNDVDLQLAEIGRIEREGGAPRSGGYICDLPRHAIDPLPIHAHVDDAIGQHRTSVDGRSEEHTSELQSLMRISYAVFCLKKKNKYKTCNKTKIHKHKHPANASTN